MVMLRFFSLPPVGRGGKLVIDRAACAGLRVDNSHGASLDQGLQFKWFFRLQFCAEHRAIALGAIWGTRLLALGIPCLFTLECHRLLDAMRLVGYSGEQAAFAFLFRAQYHSIAFVQGGKNDAPGWLQRRLCVQLSAAYIC
jgi:hypothetical protein